MAIQVFHFSSLFFSALALAPAMAHLLELPNKIHLPREEYLIVQQSYRGWALLGIVLLAALASALTLTILVRREPKVFGLTLAALLCIAAALAAFFLFTYPANLQTDNWTVLPENWQALRGQWEYSHAAGAGLHLAAQICLILSALVRTRG